MKMIWVYGSGGLTMGWKILLPQKIMAEGRKLPEAAGMFDF